MGPALVLGVIFGVIGALLLIKLLTAPLAHLLVNLVGRSTRPPSGTRPVVRMHIDGVVYDLTDTLLRDADKDGMAVWVVVGPQHVKVQPSDVATVTIEHPVPQNTHLRVMVTGPAGAVRFYTEQEIRDEFGIAEQA